jgi:hypothetical protein
LRLKIYFKQSFSKNYRDTYSNLLRRDEANMCNHTIEPIDILFNHDIINQDQLTSAMKYRTIRYKKFGKAFPTAKSYLNLNGVDTNYTDLETQEHSEELYKKLSMELQRENLLNLIEKICVYNNAPNDFLEIECLKNGLDTISEIIQQHESKHYYS